MLQARWRNRRRRNGWVLSQLDLQPTDYVLEVGYACGIDMALVARKVTNGLIIGVDHSETMFHMAFKRNKQHLDTGRMQVACCNQLRLATIFGPLRQFNLAHPLG